MAMARAGRSEGAKEAKSTALEPETAKPKTAAAKTSAEAKPKKAAAKGAPTEDRPTERLETASILAAARKGTKRGPMSKAEAAKLSASESSPAAKAAVVERPKLPPPRMPEKPAFARPQTAAVAGPDQRRRTVVLGAFLGSFLAAGMTLAGATVGVWTLAIARFMFPNILTEPPSRFKVGFPDDIAPGQVETKFKAQYGVWVVNYEFEGAAMIYALSTVCTHLGCTPNWLEGEQKFKCPCHGSGFYKDGVNFEGPAPRPLERYAIRLADDGQLEIDKSRKFQGELGQWEDPASYVPV
jgi:cytochrome b6-f complex iron-sulfur subunit